MKDLLFVKKMHIPIFVAHKPETVTDENWDFKHQQLETLYASKTGNNKLFLLKKLMTFKYKEDSLILDHINDFQGVLDQLSGMGVNFDDEMQGLWLLNTLPDSWKTLRVSLTNSAPGGKVTM
ncbi:hypothetical protein KY290_001302 [Solanum tuberosum]|uniref:Retrovirus-related Pol polyprotein from transposon TNT 1-94 n=1 Tax=Solanum tuberosum TaxID=4113 RepID=A0ABQ7WLU5_SOLTU|nr:hypothetical protein KY290_001302 [Solanum tuberosum]